MTYFLLHAGQPSAYRLIRRVGRLREYISASAVRAGDYIIRFGDTPEADPAAGYVLNPQTAVVRTKSRITMSRFLRKVGIRVLSRDKSGMESGRIIRQYRIPVFDLTVATCFRADSGSAWINQRIQRVQDHFREVSVDDDGATTRAARLATRTLHALGLSHGMVSVGMGQKGLLYVLDVSAAPLLTGRMLEVYARAMEEFMDRDERSATQGIGPFLMGADVELMLRNDAGKMVLASRYFTRRGRVGCDARSIQFDGKRLPLMELRPEPDATPAGLFANLRDTMMEATRVINRTQVQWRAGSMPFKRYWTGGHIHFSSVPFSGRLVRALDAYVGLPLMMVEDPLTARERRPKYGFLGDVRHKNYGGFEYRTPASFVVSPEVTMAAFNLAYLTAAHHRELPVFDLSNESTQFAFYNGRRDMLFPVVERIFAALKTVSTYERYREHIDPLFEMIRSGRTWDETVDVRAAWEIPLQRQVRMQARRNHRNQALRARA